MKDKPQLSAEMEIVTKFRQFLANWDYAHLTRKVSVEESRQMCDEFALTLATALEEQKEEVIEELLKHMRKVMFEWHGTGWAMVDDYKERFLNRKDTNE